MAIPTPKRAVTRFFVPMIDVLTLLFCIFLLMPYVKPGDEAGAKAEPPTEKTPAGDPEALKRDIEKLQKERERLVGDRDKAVRQQVVCVLEIDAETGRLYHRGIQRQEIATQADAFALVERERRAAIGREVYLLMLYPRELTGYPEQRQVIAYERWFADVPHGFDNPRGKAGKERR